MLLESEHRTENKLRFCASVGKKIDLKVKVKVKFTLKQANKTQRASRSIALLFL